MLRPPFWFVTQVTDYSITAYWYRALVIAILYNLIKNRASTLKSLWYKFNKKWVPKFVRHMWEDFEFKPLVNLIYSSFQLKALKMKNKNSSIDIFHILLVTCMYAILIIKSFENSILWDFIVIELEGVHQFCIF